MLKKCRYCGGKFHKSLYNSPDVCLACRGKLYEPELHGAIPLTQRSADLPASAVPVLDRDLIPATHTAIRVGVKHIPLERLKRLRAPDEDRYRKLAAAVFRKLHPTLEER